jgi:hypothetical protein
MIYVSANLRRTRDLLLPRLVSGKVGVLEEKMDEILRWLNLPAAAEKKICNSA